MRGGTTKSKERAQWMVIHAHHLAMIEDAFLVDLFDDSIALSYMQLFVKYSERYQKTVRAINKNYKTIAGAHTAFFEKYYPTENPGATC